MSFSPSFALSLCRSLCLFGSVRQGCRRMCLTVVVAQRGGRAMQHVGSRGRVPLARTPFMLVQGQCGLNLQKLLGRQRHGDVKRWSESSSSQDSCRVPSTLPS
uniref:Putative secreted protein n=1 Tax=Anopheles darlingi TaxID=43151 RepID=A0A2M4D0J9_ANODA